MANQKSLIFFYNDYESLGLEYISAVLKAAGIKTKLLYKNFSDFYAFDSSDESFEHFSKEVADEIVRQQPDVLALSLLTDTFKVNMAIAKEVKKLNPRINVLVGGIHATLLPELTLSYPQVDALCIGEGEFTTTEYMQNLDAILEGNTPVLNGIVYKQNGQFIGNLNNYVVNKDLDSLPLPDKDLFYREDPSMKSHYFVQCSRGCPFICSYCINDYLSNEIGGKRFRHRTPENIIDELMLAQKKYAPSFVVFLDECFGVDLKWTNKFLALYKEKVNLPFLVSVHPNLVNNQLADLMRDANCWYVAMGVQSLNEKSSKEILRRNISREKVAMSIEMIRSRGMVLQCDHIFGIPGETEKDMIEALAFYNENRPSIVSVFWLTYYPKANITNFAREAGIISEQDVVSIEHGVSPSGIKKVYGYHEINFWMNYLFFFPKFFIRWILNSGLYRLFKIKSFYISSALPRSIHALLNKKDWNRYYLKRIVFKKLNNFASWGPFKNKSLILKHK